MGIFSSSDKCFSRASARVVGRGVVVVMRAARRLSNYLIAETHLQIVFGGNAQGLCGYVLLVGVAPHDRGATLGRDDGVDAVFQHQHAIGNGNGQCAAAAAFARYRGDERNLQSRHLAQIVGNGFGLAAFFRAKSRIRSHDIDQGDDRMLPFLGEPHRAQCLAIAFRIGLAKIAIDALLGVAALLRTEDQHLPSAKGRHAANHGGIVAKTAVAMDLAEIGKDALDVVQRIRTHGVARQLGALPRRELASHLAAQRVHPRRAFPATGGGLPDCRRQRSPVAQSVSRCVRVRPALSKQLPYWFLVVSLTRGTLLPPRRSSNRRLAEFPSGASESSFSWVSAYRLRWIRSHCTSINNPNAAAAAQLFHTVDECPVWQNIIAFRFHHHGEVAFAFQVEQHPRRASALHGKACAVRRSWLARRLR